MYALCGSCWVPASRRPPVSRAYAMRPEQVPMQGVASHGPSIYIAGRSRPFLVHPQSCAFSAGLCCSAWARGASKLDRPRRRVQEPSGSESGTFGSVEPHCPCPAVRERAARAGSVRRTWSTSAVADQVHRSAYGDVAALDALRGEAHVYRARGECHLASGKRVWRPRDAAARAHQSQAASAQERLFRVLEASRSSRLRSPLIACGLACKSAWRAVRNHTRATCQARRLILRSSGPGA